MLGDRHGGQDSITIFLLPHRPGGHAILAGRGHLRLADEHIVAVRRGLTKGNFDCLGGLAAGHAADIDRQLTGGAIFDGDAVEGVHGDTGRLKDRARVLARTDRDFAGGAVGAHEDVTGAGDQRSELVARRRAVGGKSHRGTQGRGVGKDAVGRGGRGPQGAGLAIHRHGVRARATHDDGVALVHGLGEAGLDQVAAADAHVRDLKRVTDGVAPRGNRAGHAVDFDHDSRMRGRDAVGRQAEDSRRGESSDAENNTRRGRESAHVSADDMQGAGSGGAQRVTQVVAHNTPGYSILVLLVSLARGPRRTLEQ